MSKEKDDTAKLVAEPVDTKQMATIKIKYKVMCRDHGGYCMNVCAAMNDGWYSEKYEEETIELPRASLTFDDDGELDITELPNYYVKTNGCSSGEAIGTLDQGSCEGFYTKRVIIRATILS